MKKRVARNLVFVVFTQINLPWLKTWWAFVLYGIVLLSAFWFIRHYKLKRMQLNDQLRLKQVETDALRKLDQLKSHFFTNISHEFRTPLTLILGQIESVLNSQIKPGDKLKLQVASRNAKKLLLLINQLLDISKIESGSMKLNMKESNIIPLLKNIFHSFKTLAESKNITFRFHAELDDIHVKFDPEKTERIFYNLLSNALKFTETNGNVTVAVFLSEEGRVVISVKDNGIGIPANQLPFIFDRFFQADNSIVRKLEGTGVGLAFARELIHLQNGEIKAISTEQQGTEFTVSFPGGSCQTTSTEKPVATRSAREKRTFENNMQPEFPETSNPDDSIDPRKKLILVVEDNLDMRNYIREVLAKKYHVFAAKNGGQGFTIAQNEIPDLIITDVMMPGMDGYQFCEKIRHNEKTSHIPLIMLTAKAGFDDKMEGLESGIDAYITKPFKAKELEVQTRNLLKQRELLRERFCKSVVIKPSEVSAISADQVFLKKTIQKIEKHFGDYQFSVEKLAEHLNMSISQLNRKLNALIGQPAGQLTRSLRLQQAADLLKQNAGSVSEICFASGFNDQAYFSRAFKKQFGCSPTQYKTKNKAFYSGEKLP